MLRKSYLNLGVTCSIWVKLFKNGQSKIYGRQRLKKIEVIWSAQAKKTLDVLRDGIHYVWRRNWFLKFLEKLLQEM